MGRQKSTARRSCAAVLLPGIDDDIEQLLPPVVREKRKRPADTAFEPWPKHHHKCQRACLCGHCSTRELPLLNKHELQQQAVQPCSCIGQCNQGCSSTKADSRSRWQVEGNYAVQVDELDDGMESDTSAPDPALGSDIPGPAARQTLKPQAQASSQQRKLHNPAVHIQVQSAAPVVASSPSRMTSVAQSNGRPPLPANGTKLWRQSGKQHHLPSRLKQRPLAVGTNSAAGTVSPAGGSSSPGTGTKRQIPAAEPRSRSACRLTATGSLGTHGKHPTHPSATATEALTGKAAPAATGEALTGTAAPAATGEVLFTKVLSLTESQASCYSFYPPKPDFLEAFPKFADLRDGALKFCDAEGEQYEAKVKMVRHKVGPKAGNLNIISISYGKAFKLKHKLALGAELVFVRRRGKLVVEVRHGRQHSVKSPLSRSTPRVASCAEPRTEHAGDHTAQPMACTAVPDLAAPATAATMGVPVTPKPGLAAGEAAAAAAATAATEATAAAGLELAAGAAAAAAAAEPELAAGASPASPATAAARPQLAAGTATAASAAAAGSEPAVATAAAAPATAAARPQLAAGTAAGASAAAARPELAAGASTAAPAAAVATVSGQVAGMPVAPEPEMAAGTAAAAPTAHAAVSGRAVGTAVAELAAAAAPATSAASISAAQLATVSAVGEAGAGRGAQESAAGAAVAEPEADVAMPQQAAGAAIERLAADAATVNVAQATVASTSAAQLAADSAATAYTVAPAATMTSTATSDSAAAAVAPVGPAGAAWLTATLDSAGAPQLASSTAVQCPVAMATSSHPEAATTGLAPQAHAVCYAEDQGELPLSQQAEPAAQRAGGAAQQVQRVSQQLLAPSSEDDEDELPLGQLAMNHTIEATAQGAAQCKAAVLGKRASSAPLPVSAKRRSPAASPAAPLSTKVQLIALPLACVQQAAAPLAPAEPRDPNGAHARCQQPPPLPATSKALHARATQSEASLPGRTSKWLKVPVESHKWAKTNPPSSAADAGKQSHPTSTTQPAAALSACTDALRKCPECKCDIAGPASVMECDDGTVLHVCQRCYRRHYLKNYRLGIKLGRRKVLDEHVPQAQQPLPPPHKKLKRVSVDARSADNSKSSANPSMVRAKSSAENLANGTWHASSKASSGNVSAPAHGVVTHTATTTTLHRTAETEAKLPAVAMGGAQPSQLLVAVEGIPGHQHEWTRIDRNKYVGRQERPWGGDQVPVCDCDPAKGDTCGTECVNRMLLIECTPGYCRCGDACSNQAIARRQSPALSIRHFSGKGAGLTADEPIAAGRFVVEYTGEVVTTQEAKRRAADYNARGFRHQYVMSLSSSEVIDATVKGGLARFINHSCQPNCATQKWEVRGELRVAIVALRDISAGEELTYDYNFDWHGGPPTACLCGAPGCVLWLGARSRGFKLQGDLEEPATDGLMEADARLTWVPDDDGTLHAVDSHLDDFGDE